MRWKTANRRRWRKRYSGGTEDAYLHFGQGRFYVWRGGHWVAHRPKRWHHRIDD